jgi:hypothetical protein
VGFEPTIPASERAKTFHALDGSATVTGFQIMQLKINKKSKFFVLGSRNLLEDVNYLTSSKNAYANEYWLTGSSSSYVHPFFSLLHVSRR